MTLTTPSILVDPIGSTVCGCCALCERLLTSCVTTAKKITKFDNSISWASKKGLGNQKIDHHWRLCQAFIPWKLVHCHALLTTI